MTRVFNKSEQTDTRRSLRKTMPQPELVLWSHLRSRQMRGLKFRRQYSVGQYVVDFYCPEIKLAIEIDGDSHFVDDKIARDQSRQRYIEQFGIRFLRFTNDDVCQNTDGVLHAIQETIVQLQTCSPPCQGGVGGGR